MKYMYKIFCIAAATLTFISCSGKKADENKVIIWHWMADRKEAFGELAQKYEEKTGVEIEFKLFFPPDIYSRKVIAASRASNLPDIFGILGEKRTLASFIKAGYILNLAPYMYIDQEKWKNSFYPKTLEIVVFNKKNNYAVDAGIYGVPIDTSIMQFVYNKALLREAGLDPDAPPESLEDFISYAKKVSEKPGVVGFICGWGEGWLLNALATEWALSIMGEKKFLKTIKGDIPYTDKDWIKVFSLFSGLKDSGILAPNIATMTNKESEDAFSRGKAAFSFNGSWAVNVYKQLAPNLEYAFFPLPKVTNKHPLKIWGGAGSSFMVNTESAKKEKAVDFLKWLTQKAQQQFLIQKTNNLPSVKGCEDVLDDTLLKFLENFQYLTHPDTWPKNEDSRVLEVLNRGLQQIVMGIKTPELVAKEVQAKKEIILRR